MNKPFLLAAALAALAFPSVAGAELPAGARAPMFSTTGALAGKAFSFNLKRALKRGPVVLYFYPKAFTSGCTLEANAFAEAMGDFRAAGATVVGMSADDLPTLKKFSTEHCRDKFAVATASKPVIAAYDVDLASDGKSTGLTKRVGYVVAPGGRITLVYSDMDWRDHVKLTLAEVRRLKGK